MHNLKRTIVIITICVVAAIVAAAVVWYLRTKTQKPQKAVVYTNDFPTDECVVFEESAPEADPLIVGRWQNTDNPLWHKVYYDDFDEDAGAFWGKEWDEADNVQEEDLKYHGNGWFRWERRGGELLEYSTMDACDVPIAKIYKVLRNDGAEMCVFEKMGKKKYEFRKTAKW